MFGETDLVIEVRIDPVHQAPGWEWMVRVPGERSWDGVTQTRPEAVDRITRVVEDVVRKP